MVSFLTLFLGLLVGAHPVELAVSGDVAEVRLWLDGRQIATLSGEPWRAECDFGDDLRPHELTAASYDGAGEETRRIRQWVNLPRQRAESTLVLEPPAAGRGRSLRLVWENLEDLQPIAVRVTLDGSTLTAGEDGRFELPPLDPESPHFAVAAVEFEGGVKARTELVLGGGLGDRLDIEMTAVPLRRRSSEEVASASTLAGTLRRDDRQLRVLAVEEGRSEVVAVVERGAVRMLRAYGVAVENNPGVSTDRVYRLEPGEHLRVQSTTPLRRSGKAAPTDLFPITPEYGSEHGNLAFLLSHVDPGIDLDAQQIADAVAVAAVEAAAGNRPRAVVLILGHRWEDRSRFAVDEVRSFLRDLRVPLLVWVTGPARTALIPEDRLPLTRRTEWGPTRDISTLPRYLEAVRELRTLLDGQVVAWVEGSHLPQDVVLAKKARGLELAQ